MRALWCFAIFVGLLPQSAAAQMSASNWVRVDAMEGVSLSVPQGTTMERINWDDASGAKLRGPGFEMLLSFGRYGLAEERPYRLCTRAGNEVIGGKKAAVIALSDSSKPQLPYFVGLCMPEASIDTETSVYLADGAGSFALKARYLQLIVLGNAVNAVTAERIKLMYQTVQVN